MGLNTCKVQSIQTWVTVTKDDRFNLLVTLGNQTNLPVTQSISQRTWMLEVLLLTFQNLGQRLNFSIKSSTDIIYGGWLLHLGHFDCQRFWQDSLKPQKLYFLGIHFCEFIYSKTWTMFWRVLGGSWYCCLFWRIACKTMKQVCFVNIFNDNDLHLTHLRRPSKILQLQDEPN